jgi:hypothetical protein
VDGWLWSKARCEPSLGCGIVRVVFRLKPRWAPNVGTRGPCEAKVMSGCIDGRIVTINAIVTTSQVSHQWTPGGLFTRWLKPVITMLVMPPFNHYALRHDNHGVITVFRYLQCLTC